MTQEQETRRANRLADNNAELCKALREVLSLAGDDEQVSALIQVALENYES